MESGAQELVRGGEARIAHVGLRLAAGDDVVALVGSETRKVLRERLNAPARALSEEPA